MKMPKEGTKAHETDKRDPSEDKRDGGSGKSNPKPSKSTKKMFE